MKTTDYIKLIFLIYLIMINFAGFFAMGIDKRKARKHKWRIRESAFFIIALLLGSAGTWIGMYVFRHKTKHWYFVLGMPAILAAQIAVAVWLCCRT